MVEPRDLYEAAESEPELLEIGYHFEEEGCEFLFLLVDGDGS